MPETQEAWGYFAPSGRLLAAFNYEFNAEEQAWNAAYQLYVGKDWQNYPYVHQWKVNVIATGFQMRPVRVEAEL